MTNISSQFSFRSDYRSSLKFVMRIILHGILGHVRNSTFAITLTKSMRDVFQSIIFPITLENYILAENNFK